MGYAYAKLEKTIEKYWFTNITNSVHIIEQYYEIDQEEKAGEIFFLL